VFCGELLKNGEMLFLRLAEQIELVEAMNFDIERTGLIARAADQQSASRLATGPNALNA
jgi:hypothetical protein